MRSGKKQQGIYILLLEEDKREHNNKPKSTGIPATVWQRTRYIWQHIKQKELVKGIQHVANIYKKRRRICENLEKEDFFLPRFALNKAQKAGCLHKSCQKEDERVIGFVLWIWFTKDLNGFVLFVYGEWDEKKLNRTDKKP